MVHLFTFTSLLGAFLLFCVQPLAGRMLLPTYGGASSVWTACMLFFQGLLLAGYAFAHLLARRGSVAQLATYALLLALAVFAAPLAWVEPTTSGASPELGVLAALVGNIGAPGFLACATAPLLQRWFSRLPHAAAGDPYFLYAASNTGSLAALLAYPLVLEPLFSTRALAGAWNGAFALLGLAMLACAGVAARAPGSAASRASEVEPARVTTGDRAGWIFRAFIPASLMMGVTLHVSTSVAAVPLLWVVPLAIYLLTFILAFARREWIPTAALARVVPYALVLLLPLVVARTRGLPWLTIPLNLLVVGAVSLIIHRELAARRPPVAALTEYYLCLAGGGVLAGLFNALVAPLLFTSTLEYPLVLALAPLALRGAGSGARRALLGDSAIAVAYGLASFAVLGVLERAGLLQERWAAVVFIGVPAVVCFGFKDRPLRFALACALYLSLLHHSVLRSSGDVVHAERNFFGTKYVLTSRDGTMHSLYHGSIRHGAQYRAPPEKRSVATTYYAADGPLGDVFDIMAPGEGTQHVGAVGLGVGTLAAYAREGRHITFFEIDPGIERLARDERLFSYLADCGARCDVELGDGRLLLSRSERVFDVIVMDAFSAATVPVHLLTAQAVQSYMARLSERGVLVFHISNQYLDLEPVIAGLARSAGGIALGKRSNASDYALIARPDCDLRAFHERGWRPLEREVLWTDEHSNVLSVIRW